MPILLPNSVADQILAEKAGKDEAKRVFGPFRRALKDIDERLDVFLCDEQGYDEIRYGFYYIIRRGDGGTTGIWEISNDDGSYREPGERELDEFKKMDRETLQDFRDQRDAERAKTAKAAEREREENLGRLKEMADYTFRVQHPVKHKPFGRDS